MFQEFRDTKAPGGAARHIRLLRAELERLGLAGFLVPRSDEYMNEYVPDCAERLSWLTGFTGSAGLAVILSARAAIFVDGRYTLQARKQLDKAVLEVLQTPDHRVRDWLSARLMPGDRLGYDPRLHTAGEIERMGKALEGSGAILVPVKANPVDAVWTDQPAPPMAPIVPHPLKFAGVPADRKIAGLQKDLLRAGVAACVLPLPESVAWLLNIRGGDVPHAPLPLCQAILPAKGPVQLFAEPRKVPAETSAWLKGVAVLEPPEAIAGRLSAFAGKKVRIDPDTASAWFKDTLERAGAEIVKGADPCLLPKARKNTAEIAGARAAHKRDGVAMCRFLAWIAREAPKGKVDEIAAAQKLEAMRAQTGKLREISFDTISGAGPNGAIVHYRVTKASNRKLKRGQLYLVDSGAQYLDGTTDITRTLAIGKPSPDMRRHFTLVLKGNIAIATARFPVGTRGQDLDPLARRALWAAGLDYDHGTGHGVGSYLSVHEGPARISRLGTVSLEPGMILSNEPGYYRTGKYGIRIENLVLVTKAAKPKGGERSMLGFETLTLAPIDRSLVDASLIDAHESSWLDAYHAKVLAALGPKLKGAERAWLKTACAPLMTKRKRKAKR